ncbi:uncharacterized protein TEOVI_000294500 [Trypanosoma equiperdum]|uniref:Uncharacterized protein n=1 Tax=Trypanosoma equiperdum TaxID=5694 RepID=A0A1G4IG45_TRYEQ|nr:hypothetical protein, conserved [Trypanosoma equiperdum]
MRPTGESEKFITLPTASRVLPTGGSPADGGQRLQTTMGIVSHGAQQQRHNSQNNVTWRLGVDDSVESNGLNVHVRVRDSRTPTPFTSMFVSSSSSSPLTARSTSGYQEEETSPYSISGAEYLSAGEHIAHTALSGKCSFFSFPEGLPSFRPPSVPAERTHKLFIGQLRFEMSLEALVWFLHETVNVNVCNIEKRGCGCAIISLSSEADREAVLQLKERLLVDIGGMWYARSDEECCNLHNYIDCSVAHIPRPQKVPQRLVVIEEARTGR